MYGKVFELYMLMIILVIPVSVMLVTYTWIAHIIWNVATRRAVMRSARYIKKGLIHVSYWRVKRYLRAYAKSEDWEQSARPRSLISFFPYRIYYEYWQV